MIMNYGYEHIIIGSDNIYIEMATADLESKYRKVRVVYLHTKKKKKKKEKKNELRYFEGHNSECLNFLPCKQN